jgi:hypothetical protein
MTATGELATLAPLLERLGPEQAAAAAVLGDCLDRAATQELSFADFLHGVASRPQSVLGAMQQVAQHQRLELETDRCSRTTEIREIRCGRRALSRTRQGDSERRQLREPQVSSVLSTGRVPAAQFLEGDRGMPD